MISFYMIYEGGSGSLCQHSLFHGCLDFIKCNSLKRFFFLPVVSAAQASQVEMGPQEQGMVGMEDVEGIKHVLEWHTVTCMNLNTLGVEVVAQEDWAEV